MPESKEWQEDLCVLTNGFKVNGSGKCTPYKSVDGGHVILCLYANDLLIFFYDLDVIKKYKIIPYSNFDIKDLVKRISYLV